MSITKDYKRGFTLVELLVAMALGILITLIVIQLFAGTKQTYRLQEGLTRVQENGRIAMHIIADEVRKTGFRVPVWNEPLTGYYPLTGGSIDGDAGASDTLQMMYQDSIDCVGVVNTTIDPETAEPTALYKRMTFSVDNQQNLRRTCEYGASPTVLTVQYTNQNIIEGVESFQVLYGVDTDFPPNFSVNNWTTAANITPQSTVCLQSEYLCEAESLLNTMQAGVPVAMKIALLIASPENAEADEDQQSFNVLDVTVAAAGDHKMRKLFTSTVTIRNLTL